MRTSIARPPADVAPKDLRVEIEIHSVRGHKADLSQLVMNKAADIYEILFGDTRLGRFSVGVIDDLDPLNKPEMGDIADEILNRGRI